MNKHRSILLYPPILFIFWICSFSIFRIFFFYFNTTKSSESIEGFYHGLLLDISTASYLLVPAICLWLLSLFKNKIKHVKELGFILNIVLFTMVTIVEISSLSLYKEWGTTFNARAYEYLFNFSELSHTVADHASIVLVSMLIITLAIGFFFLYHISSFYDKTDLKFTPKVLLALILFGLCFTGLRGGLGKLPISPGNAFYSKDISNNYMSVNKAYYFIHSLTKAYNPLYSENSYSKNELDELYNSIYTKKDTSNNKILKLSKPNILLIILEGIPADVVEPLNGLADVTPNLNTLCKDGMLFRNIYSSGMRTDQGLLSILSGLPALSSLNVMSDIEITNKLPSLLRTFKDNDYHTSFIYGGSLDFCNINNYVLNSKADLTISKSSFDLNEQNISWGVADDLLFEKSKKALSKVSGPFFSTILTQSSHPPFDINTTHKFKGDDTPSKFKSSVYYTDSCLGSFLKYCEKQEWYDNTLFVIVSDHGSLYLENRHYNHHRRFQVPLILYGPALNHEYKGQSTDNYGNHHDIPKTLLSILGIRDSVYLLSKDLLSGRDLDHAYWTGEQTIGWLHNEQKIVVDHLSKEVYFKEISEKNDSIDVNNALKYQKLIADYLYKY